MIIETTVGPADVLHRLALAVEPIDALTGRPGVAGVRVGREVDPRLLPRDADRSWPCLDLATTGAGRFILRHEPVPPEAFTIRIVDPARRFSPRRLRVHLWLQSEVEAADVNPPAGPFVPAGSRLVRPWLLLGSAGSLFRSVTAIRGRVERNGIPVRWPRVTALDPGAVTIGWAHGDERGEFLLALTGTGVVGSPPSTFEVDLAVSAPGPRPLVPPGDPADRYADLVVEDVPRSAAPPTATDLDNPLLRGRAAPPGYVDSTGAKTRVQVTVGELLTLSTPVVFAA